MSVYWWADTVCVLPVLKSRSLNKNIWQLQTLCKCFVFTLRNVIFVFNNCVKSLLIQLINSRGHFNYFIFFIFLCNRDLCWLSTWKNEHITHLLTCMYCNCYILVIYYFPKLTRAIDWSYGFALCFLKRPVETQVTYVKSPKPYICGAWTPSLLYWKTNHNVAALWPHQWLDAHGHIH